MKFNKIDSTKHAWAVDMTSEMEKTNVEQSLLLHQFTWVYLLLSFKRPLSL